MIETELTYINLSLCESQWQCLHNHHMVIHDVCTLSCNRNNYNFNHCIFIAANHHCISRKRNGVNTIRLSHKTKTLST